MILAKRHFRILPLVTNPCSGNGGETGRPTTNFHHRVFELFIYFSFFFCNCLCLYISFLSQGRKRDKWIQPKNNFHCSLFVRLSWAQILLGLWPIQVHSVNLKPRPERGLRCLCFCPVLRYFECTLSHCKPL